MMIPLAVAGGMIYWESDKRMSGSALRLSSQIVNNLSLDFDQLISDVDKLSEQIVDDSAIQQRLSGNLTDQTERESIQTALGMQLKRLGTYYEAVSGVYLVLDNGMVAKSRYYSVREKLGMSAELYQLARNHAAMQWVCCPNGSMLVNNMGDAVLSAVTSLTNAKSGQPCGVVVIEVKLSEIKRMMCTDLGENSNVFLIGRDGTLLSSMRNDERQAELVTDLMRSEAIGNELEVREKKDYFLLYSRLPSSGWTICGLVHKDFLREDSRSILQTVLWIGLLASLINVVVSRGLCNYELRPITAMMKYVKTVETGEFTAELSVVRKDEIGALANSIRNMTAHISELLKTVQHEQARLRWAEYKALQAQINPHFLYNTLDSLHWLIWDGDNDKAGEMVTALTSFFRIGLSQGSDLILVENEVKHVDSYLAIQKIRYNKIFTYSIYIDDCVRGYMTPKLLLQPIVENALYHGIKPAGHKCHLFVNVLEVEDDLLMEVRDDGAGMSPEQLQSLRDSLECSNRTGTEGYGMRNVCDRIRILVGKEYEIQVMSEQGMGTSVRLRIPKTLGGLTDVSGNISG
ncbi:cache domain-containing sensor histidine kinase [Butyricicoccus sp. Marseille-Q5471]|uniref:cache domain-containing sensor histidine kinase n=1 Tax=Butyricicoccus sp. Marseille-Q5471 TaxID=3039493 RepID=UPI0024BCD45D|nr:sensor histidine kinase [Butyricicoccus sp. Marseille-Q5471]